MAAVVERNGVYTFIDGERPELPCGIYTTHVGGQLYVKPVELAGDTLAYVGSEPERIVQEIAAFLRRRDRYRAAGIAHYRGILLHGKPGTGKTSTIRKICHLGMKMGCVSFMPPSSGDADTAFQCAAAYRKVSDAPIIIPIEDIDRYAEDADLLAAMDGNPKLDGVVVVATTNHLDRIPDTIKKRPSRIDLVVELQLPDMALRHEFLGCLIARFGLSYNEDDHKRWAAKTDGFSYAHLKEFLVSMFFYERTERVALAALREMSALPDEGRIITESDDTDF